MAAEVLIEVYRITERRNGDVFKTKYVEDKWVLMGSVSREPDLIYVVKSSDYTEPTIRTV